MGIFLLIRLGAFLLIPCAYWSMDLLNYSQAGKSALLGGLAVLAVSSWSASRATTRGGVGSGWAIGVVTPFVFILAVEAFLRDFFGVSHDDGIVIEALFNSNGGEAAEFVIANSRGMMKHSAFFALALLLFASAAWASGRYHPLTSGRSLGAGGRSKRRNWPLLTFGGLFLLVHLNPTMRKADPFLYFPIRYAKWEYEIEKTRQLQEQLRSTLSDPHLQSMQYAGEGARTVVFMLGESTTRLNWSLYGYPRETTPRLQGMADDLLVFQDVLTGFPGTDGSIKQIFTPATLQKPNLWAKQPDILTMASRAGYKTFWLSNHSTDRQGAVSIISSHADVTTLTNKGGSRGEGSYDEVLLPEFQRALDDPAPRKFIILHMLGAHPAYHFRYPEPFAIFDDAEDDITRQLLEQGRAPWAVMLRNQDDNAMVYMDYLLSKMIDMARSHAARTPTAWLFAPDHGEDVAHYTNFSGHNSRVRSMYEIPLIFWSSPGFSDGTFDREAVRARPYQLDVLDNTLLGLLAVRGDYYEASSDLFSPEFRPGARTYNNMPYP
ncbi:MAG: sulfatase-like hydrolase/transferase [Gammaproteobacteria bacterium]|nr:sulfatase-like hydrolase/transferase [Gammaproteobacteria bacterium]